MIALRAFLHRVWGLFGRQRRERELADEMECHLQMQTEANLRAGMSPAEARRAALLKSGGVEAAKEAWRDRRSLPALEIAMRDLRHTLRLLSRSPAFTVVAILSLALGIGANTAIFTLLDQIVLRPLPVPHPEQLQMIWTTGPSLGSNQGSRASSYPMYQDFQQNSQAFSYVFCRSLTPVSLSAGNQTERVTGELVSGNYFQALGVKPALGRVFSPAEDDRTYKGHPVVVLSHQYWVARFGADAGVLGQKILVNNYPMVIVGVSAAGFSGMDPARSPQIRIPIQMKPLMTPGSDNLGDRRRQWIHIFARRKPGYMLESAQASLQPLLSAVLRAELESAALRERPQRDRDRFLARTIQTESAASGYSSLPTSYSRALVVLMGMVGLVLLIACFNVASLLIARAAARQKELAMRLAIGASRGQLLRQLLMESLVLSFAGGAAGLLLSALGMIRTLRAIERLGQNLHRYGLRPPEGMPMMPILRFPVPPNPRPEALTYDKMRGIYATFLADLEGVDALLATFPQGAVKLPVDLIAVRLDLNGDGVASEAESLGAILTALNGGRGSGPRTGPEKFEVAFDRADVVWLRGYANLMCAFLEFALAYDWRDTYAATAHLFFSGAQDPSASTAASDNLVDRFVGRGGARIADAIAMIHLIRWPVAEPARMARARTRLLQVVALSKENWKEILAETDDDREWLPGPHQKNSVFPGAQITQERVNGWLHALDAFKDALDGKVLVPHWRYNKGVDLAAFFMEPRSFDLVLWMTGHAALPYLKDGPVLSQAEWDQWQRIFGGQFMTYAIWFN